MASTCASSLHYATSRLASSDAEMHGYYCLAAVVSMLSMFVMSGAMEKRDIAIEKKEKAKRSARQGRIRSISGMSECFTPLPLTPLPLPPLPPRAGSDVVFMHHHFT